jgi:hypothetical protein
MKPIHATTDKKIRELSHDNIDAAGGHSALLECDRIHLYLSDGSSLTIPRKAFDDIVIWYTEGVIPKSDKRKDPKQ